MTVKDFTCFPKSALRRETMCRRFELFEKAIQTGEFENIQMTLADFLAEARSLRDVISSEGAKLQGFRKWWKQKRKDFESDPIMNWCHMVRIEDFHKGNGPLIITGIHFGGETKIEGASEDPNGPKLVVHSGVDGSIGLFLVTNPNKVEERIERKDIVQKDVTLSISVLGLDGIVPTPASMADILNLARELKENSQKLVFDVTNMFTAISSSSSSATS